MSFQGGLHKCPNLVGRRINFRISAGGHYIDSQQAVAAGTLIVFVPFDRWVLKSGNPHKWRQQAALFGLDISLCIRYQLAERNAHLLSVL